MLPNINEPIRARQILSLIETGSFQTNDILWGYNATTGDFSIDGGFYITTEYEKGSVKYLKDFSDLLVLSDATELEKKLETLSNGEFDKIQFNLRIKCKSGSIKTYMVKASLFDIKSMHEEDCIQKVIIGSMVDLEEKKIFENKINQIAYYDSITQLPNWPMFLFKSASILVKRTQDEIQGALVYVNIDNFKSVNSLYGRHVGNEVLKRIADVLKQNLVPDNIVARHSGDEFLILLKDVHDLEETEKKVKQMLKVIKKHFNINEIEVGITCSAGIALYPFDGDSIEELVINAEVGMYFAKQEGRNTYRFFEKSMRDKLNKHLELEKSLKGTKDGNELYIVYQPQVDMHTGRIIGTEALMRWESKEHGNIPPDVFIPVAESSGLILTMGSWILQQVCDQCKKWYDAGMFIPVAVNISSVQLKDEKFCKMLIDIIEKAGLPPQMLEIEITESAMIHDLERVTSILQYLQNKGLRIVLDDFGTGYSSLNYIKQLPLDTIKMDRSFIKNLKEDKKEKAIAGIIITLAHVLGMAVIAEGVETKEQYDYLKKIGCNTVQGYYISKPLRVKEYEKFLYQNLLA